MAFDYHSIKPFQIGDRVVFNEECREAVKFYEQSYDRDGKRTIGTIERLNNMESFIWASPSCLEEWLYVKWDNGVTNAYQVQMLLYENETEEEKRMEREKEINDLMGCKVCLNPEHKNFTMNLKDTGMEYGYIYKTVKDGKIAYLITDKEQECIIKTEELLIIEGDKKQVRIYKIIDESGYAVNATVMEGYKKQQRTMDNAVINGKWKVLNEKVYN